MNKTRKNFQFGDKVTAAMMFTYCDGTQEIRAYQGDSFYEFLLIIKKQGYTIDKHNVKPIETDAFGEGTVEINLELSSYSSKMTISKRLEFK